MVSLPPTIYFFVTTTEEFSSQQSIRQGNKGFSLEAGNSETPYVVQLTRYDDDQDQDDNAGDDAHAHLHVLPPHLLPDTVGAPTETLSRHGQVVCLVLQIVDALATLVGHVDVVPHGVNGGLHGLWRRMMSAVLHMHIENLKPSFGDWML